MLKPTIIILSLIYPLLTQQPTPSTTATPSTSQPLQSPSLQSSPTTTTPTADTFPNPFLLLLQNLKTAKPGLNQIKQVQYKLEPLINQYVITTIFNSNQELFGLENKNGTPSWIYIDEDGDEHQTCFQDIFNVDYAVDDQQGTQLQTNDPPKPQPKSNTEDNNQQQAEPLNIQSDLCLPIQPIKCLGLCKKLGSLPPDQPQNPYLEGTNLYQIQLMSLGYNIKKSFISAKSFTVKSYHKGLLSTDDIEFGTYWVRDFYVSIVGEINVGEFQYMVVGHRGDDDESYYYVSVRDSFGDFGDADVVKTNLGATVNAKVTVADKILVEKPLKFQTRFNSSQMSLGLPQSLYDSLYNYIFSQIFQNKCTPQPDTTTILTCKTKKTKQLEQTTLSFCLDPTPSPSTSPSPSPNPKTNTKNCFEFKLDQILLLWEDEEEEQAKTQESYQYFYVVRKEIQGDVVVVYPEFAASYQVLMKDGDVYGFAKYQNEEIDHLKQLLYKIKQGGQDHQHHEHVEQPQAQTNTSNPSLTPQSAQLQAQPQKYSSLWPIATIAILLLTLSVIGYGCYKFMTQENQGQIGQAEQEPEGEEGNLADGKRLGRKKIFEEVETVVMTDRSNQEIGKIGEMEVVVQDQ